MNDTKMLLEMASVAGFVMVVASFLAEMYYHSALWLVLTTVAVCGLVIMNS